MTQHKQHIGQRLVETQESPQKHPAGVVDVAAGGGSVQLGRYPASHPFAQLQGSDNIIAFTTQRYSSQPLIIRCAQHLVRPPGAAVARFQARSRRQSTPDWGCGAIMPSGRKPGKVVVAVPSHVCACARVPTCRFFPDVVSRLQPKIVLPQCLHTVFAWCGAGAPAREPR